MKGTAPRFAIGLLGLALVACKPATPPAPDPNADAIARQFFDEVRTGADLENDPHLATEAQIAEFRALIPAEPYKSVELRSSSVSSDSAGTTTKLADVYAYGDRALLVQTALFKSPAGVEPVIVGFRVDPDTGAGG